jgi:hypothetical protein
MAPKVKMPAFTAVLLSLLLVSSIAVTGCAEKTLPPVFKDAYLFADHSLRFIDTPRIYNNIGPLPADTWMRTEVETELPDAPQELVAYRIIRPEVDVDYATRLASSLGFDGEPGERYDSVYPLNGFSFRNGEHVLSIFEDGSIRVRYVLEPARPASLPSDEECVAIARKWLEDHGLYPDNIMGTSVSPNVECIMYTQEKIEIEYTQNMNVTFSMGLDGYELLGMGAYVAIGENGEVLEVYVNAPEFEQYTTVGVRRPQAALDTFNHYLQHPELFYSDAPKCLVDTVGSDRSEMRVTGISIKYFCMLTEENAAPAFAQPIYILDGYYKTTSGGGTVSFNARVDAVIR